MWKRMNLGRTYLVLGKRLKRTPDPLAIAVIIASLFLCVGFGYASSRINRFHDMGSRKSSFLRNAKGGGRVELRRLRGSFASDGI